MNPGYFPEVIRSIAAIARRIRPCRNANHFFLGTAIRIFNLHAHAVFNTHIVLQQEGDSNKRIEIQTLGPGIFGTLERMNRSSIGVIKSMVCRHTAEAVQEGHFLGKVRHRHAHTDLRPHRRGIDIHGVFSGLGEIFLPLQVTRYANVPNRERNARPHLELTGYRMPKVTLINNRIYMVVSILGKAHIIVSMIKTHIASDNVIEATVTVTVTQAKAIQIILQRSHTLVFIQLRQGKVFAYGVGTCSPVKADFAPLDLIKGACHRIFLTKASGQIQHLQRRRELKAVRLRNGPIIFLQGGFIHKVKIIGYGLLLVKVRTKVSAEGQERNQSRIEANLELL